MRKIFTVIFLIWGIYGFAQTTNSIQHNHTNEAQEVFQSGFQFTQNKNQWDKSVRYRVDIPSGVLFLKNNTLQYSFYDAASIHASHAHAFTNRFLKKFIHGSSLIKAHSFEVKFLNANRLNAEDIKGNQAFTHKKNYFLGSDPSRWATDVLSFASVDYTALYDGIDMKVYQKENALKYEFVVSPFADPNQIAMMYEHAEDTYLQEGDLHIKTSLMKVIEKKPYCYQIIDERKVEIPARFVLQDNVLSYEFPEGYAEDHELIIDPELVFSTYSGSTGDNWGSTATYDAAGNVYTGGIVFATGFPTTTGAFQVNFGGIADVGILKFDPNTTPGENSLVYATYIGGTETEFPHSLVVNSQDELVIFGTTSSLDFPVAANAYDTTFNGGDLSSLFNGAGGTINNVIEGIQYNNGSDIFLSKLNSTGSQLLGSTYVGGTDNDGLNLSRSQSILNYGDQFRGEVITDSLDNIYVATCTLSDDFPMVNAFDSTYGGALDGLILKFAPDLDALEWSSYLGGESFDVAYSMKINVDGNLYVSGGTRSVDLRTGLDTNVINPGPLGNDDGFVTAIDSSGNLIQITYIGTASADQAFFIDFDEDGDLYVMGQTFGAYPISPGVFNNANSGQFIHKLSPDLSQSLWSTVVGSGDGAPDISPTAFLVSSCGNIYIAGWAGASGLGSSATVTTTADFLTTNNLIDLTTDDAFTRFTDGQDFFIAIFESDMQSLLYGTFLGGITSSDHVDGGTSRFSKDGVIYQAACASCGNSRTDFPTTANAFSVSDNSPAGRCNNAVFKIDLGNLIADFDIFDAITSTPVARACEFPVSVDFEYNGVGATSWEWFIEGTPAGTTRNISWNFDSVGVYTIELIARNPISCLESDTIRKAFPISTIEVGGVANDTIVCFDESIQLDAQIVATNAFTYQWTPAAGLSDPNIPNPIASPDQTTNYLLTVMDDNGCTDTASVLVEVIQPLMDNFDILDFSGVAIDRTCVPANVILFYDVEGAGTPTWTWDVEGFGTFVDQDSVNLVFDEVGTYEINLSAIRGGQCPQTESVTRFLTVVDLGIDTNPDTVICEGESIELLVTSTGDASFIWTPDENISQTNIPNPVVSPIQSTTYSVTATNPEGCIEFDQVNVEVIPEITANFDFRLDSDCGRATILTLSDSSSGAVNYSWFIGDQGFLSGANPDPYVFTPEEAGTVEVRLIASNGKCEDIQVFTIDVEDNQTPLPNIITPGNDDLNNTFDITTDFVNRNNYQLEIYNRWGNTIYTSDNYQNDWGPGIEPGVYFYLMKSPSGVVCRGWVEVVK